MINTPSISQTFGYYLSCLRPWQWIKNVFLILPLFFSGQMMNWNLVYSVLLAFVGFCCISSSIYCINDIHDCEADKAHPVKCKRPLAAGLISSKIVLIIAFTLCLCGFLLFSLNIQVLYIGLLYFVLNIGYCLGLKNQPFIDIAIISVGFVLRLVAGAFATDIELSHWIVIMTFLLALFLALAKRRDDVFEMEKTGITHRKAIEGWSIKFIDLAITIVATITIVAYLMYTVSPEVALRTGSRFVYVTALFPLLGILRYLQIAVVENKSGEPTKVVYTDRFIQGCIACWILCFVFILYI